MKVEMSDLRISPVQFDAGEHTYRLGERELKGVTPIISWLYPDTYQGIPEEVLQRAAEYGTMIHSKCQLADAIGQTDEPVVVRYMELMKAAGLVPLVHEYTVSDEENIASQIDIVCQGGELCDIKTTSKLHRMNVTIQLSIYAWLYEMQTGLEAKGLYAVWLPKEQYGQPMIYEMPRISSDTCQFIVEEYINGNDNTKALEALESIDLFGENTLQKDSEIMMSEYIRLDAENKRITERMNEIKAQLMDGMRATETKTLSTDRYTVSLRAASVRKSIDSKKLKAEFPDVYAQCEKESVTEETIQIKIL